MSFFQRFKKFVVSLKKRFLTYFNFLHEHKNARWCFWILMLIPVAGILVLVVILPLNMNLPVEDSQLSNTNEFISVDDSVDNFGELKKFSSHLFDLKIEEMFLNSQLLMAKGDSIGLILDVVDSTLSLYIRGVNIRECQIHRFKISHAFKHLKADQWLFHWLSRPFMLEKDWATIPKVPIKIRKAPKDTIEAKKNKTEPVTLDKPDVHYTLKFDRNLFIKIHQVESNSFWGVFRKWYYNLRLYSILITDTFLAFFHFKTPQSPLWIELRISKNDALAIYRALPSHAALALRL